jgi:mono/diheme cytochrome c family protein
VFPPLAGSEYVNGPANRVIAIILHGLQGPITVNGAMVNSVMMPYGTGVEMTDEQIAIVATYVRSSWGNTGTAVTAADVARVREATKSRTTQWTAAELPSIK